MADSTHQLQDDAALDAQVAELSKDLAADAEAGGGAPIAGTPSDAEIDLDEALFAAAPAVSQLEVTAILGDESKPGVVNADASTAPTPPSPPSSPATNKPGPSAARTPAESQASSVEHDDAGFVAVSAMTAEAVDRAEQGHAAAAQSNEDGSTEAIDSLLNEVSEELAETAQSIEETKAAAVAIDTAQPITDSGAQAEVASPETPEIVAPTAAAMPATNKTAAVSATGEAAIEALDTHLAANASSVLEEAERLQSAQGQAGATGTASNASAEADADVDDAAFAPPPTESPTQASVATAVSTGKPDAAQSNAAVQSAPTSAPAKPAAAASPVAAPKASPAAAETKPRKPLSTLVRPIASIAVFPIVKVSERIPPKLLHTLGMIGVITLLNGAAFWTFRLLRSSDGAVPPSKSTVPFLRPGDEAPHAEGEHGSSSDADTSNDGGAAEKPPTENGHGATDSHGAKEESHEPKKDNHSKAAESADSGHAAKKDSHGQAGGGHGGSKAAEKPKKLSRTAKERMNALKAKDAKAPPSGSHGGGH